MMLHASNGCGWTVQVVLKAESFTARCRAEATDVANAVLDGVDCIMLGAETLRGKQPVATVETILHICKQAEKVFDHNYHFETLMRVSNASGLRSTSTNAQCRAVSCSTCCRHIVVCFLTLILIPTIILVLAK